MPVVLFAASTCSHIVQFHRPYLRRFREAGWRVHAACGGASLPIPEAERVIPLPFEKKMTSPANFRAQRLLRSAMVENRYDLICTHTSLAAFFTRRAAAGLSSRPPIVNVAHGYLFDAETPLLKRTLLLTAERLTAPQTDLLLTMNDADDAMARRWKLGRQILKIPGIGVDFSRLRPVSTEETAMLRAQYAISPEAFVLLYAAEFSARKNQAMLIRALPLLPERVVLALPGSGALEDACRALSRALGVERRVVFPGQIADMPPWYSMAGAAVSASRSEGLPFNVMEAMYAALPVIASQVKGHTDLLENGKTGLLYPFDDDAAFAAQVRRVLAEPGFGSSLGAAAHAAALRYGLETVAPLVMDAYRSVL